LQLNVNTRAISCRSVRRVRSDQCRDASITCRLHPLGHTTNARDGHTAPKRARAMCRRRRTRVTKRHHRADARGRRRNPANLPGYDFTRSQFSVVAKRRPCSERCRPAVPLSFADVYNGLAGWASALSRRKPARGFPGFFYIDLYGASATSIKFCAVATCCASGLVEGDHYVIVSGSATRSSPPNVVYFKYATAAGVLQVTKPEGCRRFRNGPQRLASPSRYWLRRRRCALAAYAGAIRPAAYGEAQ